MSMEMIGVCCASAATIEFCKTFSAFFFCINVTAFEFIPNVGTFYAVPDISHQEFFISYKLMARIEITPRCNCQVLGT